MIEKNFDKLDILVNNAGINGGHDWNIPPSQLSLDYIRTVFETNFFGAIAVTQAMLPLLKVNSADPDWVQADVNNSPLMRKHVAGACP